MTPAERAARDRHPAGTGIWTDADTDAAWAALDEDSPEVEVIAVVDLTAYMAHVRAAQDAAHRRPRAPLGIVAGLAITLMFAGPALILATPALSGGSIAGALITMTGLAVLVRLITVARRNEA